MKIDDNKITELAKQAILGSSESLNKLCELSQGRVYAYIYRIVLCSDTSNDLKQETMLEMCKSIRDLREAEKFWPWLRSIAYHNVCNYYNKRKRRKAVSLSAINGEEWIPGEIHKFKSGFGNSISIELEKLVFSAVSQLNAKYRAIITMRCFEDATYEEISETMGLSTIGVRMAFYRAKKSLQKHLIKKGFKKEFLASAILLFGQMTAESEAAAASLTIPTASVSVTIPAAILSVIASKISLTILAAAAITMVAVKMEAGKKFAYQANQRLVNISRKNDSFQSAEIVIAAPAKEQWFYYPQNSKGPSLRKIVENQTLCSYLNDGNANYYSGEDNITYIKNANLYNNKDFSVLTVPSDTHEMKEFLCATQGKDDNNIYITNQLESSLVIVRSDNFSNEIKIIENKNLLEEEFYKYDISACKVVDQRDQAHKRGWTYFEVTGELADKKITGKGRLPFVYNQLLENEPALELNLDSSCKFIDKKFSFLARPWMGIHTIDIIRRDAAENKIKFDTKILPTCNKAEITIFSNHATLVYTVDLSDDVIDRIDFTINAPNAIARKGYLKFNYLDEISDQKNIYAELCSSADKSENNTLSWFDWLADNCQF